MFAGASNAPGGITFDMKNINDVLISANRETTIVGTGNTWGDVYKVLDPTNRTVIGGRDTGVGVGGFTLGGTSFFPLFKMKTTDQQRRNQFPFAKARLGGRQR